jgi:hypothetical protein
MAGFSRLLSLIFISFFLVIAGCATAPKTLQPEWTAKLTRVAVLVNESKKELQVFDRTNTTQKTYTGYQGGAIGGLIEGTVLALEAGVKVRQSLGGDPKLLRESVGDLEVEEIVYESLKKKLTGSYEIVDLNESCAIENQATTKSEGASSGSLSTCKSNGFDAIIKVDLSHGVAAYAGETASAVINADIEIIDPSKDKALLKKMIQSDQMYRKGRNVKEFSANSGEAYRKDLLEAADSVSLQVAAAFGIAVEEAKERIIDSEYPTLFTTCSKPYRLSQDCSSWNGAKRLIEINNYRLKVAGSDDGKVVLVMNAHQLRNAVATVLTLGVASVNTRDNMDSLRSVEGVLSANDIRILKKVKLVSPSDVDGFILELDRDGYSILRKYSIGS